MKHDLETRVYLLIHRRDQLPQGRLRDDDHAAAMDLCRRRMGCVKSSRTGVKLARANLEMDCRLVMQFAETATPSGPRMVSRARELGKKWQAAVDALGLMLGVAVTPASVQDRDQIAPLLREVRRLFRFRERAIADSG